MILKVEITKNILNILNPGYSEKDFKHAFGSWWISTRKKNRGGLRLTPEGFNAFINADIKNYRILYDSPVFFSNQILIWLDQFIECPFFVTPDGIYVFGEKMAVQLVLFSGNIAKFSHAKAASTRQV